jgi:hypothetical protein
VQQNTGIDTLASGSSAPVLGATSMTPRGVGGESGSPICVCHAESRFVDWADVCRSTSPSPSSTRISMVASNPPPVPATSSGSPIRSFGCGWSTRNGDRVMTLLLPRSTRPHTTVQTSAAPT